MAYDKAATACVGNWGGGNSRPDQKRHGCHGRPARRISAARQQNLSAHHELRTSAGEQAAKSQFVISNPARGSFPKWTADPLPDTQSDGDLDVTLTKLDYGAHRLVRRRHQPDKERSDEQGRAVAFTPSKKAWSSPTGSRCRLETSDATGNEIRTTAGATVATTTAMRR